jgi:HNH endonuclease
VRRDKFYVDLNDGQGLEGETGRRVKGSMSRLVYEAFKGPTKEDEWVHHIDFNLSNCRLENLQKLKIIDVLELRNERQGWDRNSISMKYRRTRNQRLKGEANGTK